MPVYRVLMKGGYLPAWAEADQEEKDRVTRLWLEFHAEWVKLGAKLVSTLDDNIFRCGLPGGTKPWTFYELWEIPDIQTVKLMLDLFRPQQPGSVRVDKYLRVEAIVGTPIKAAEDAVRATD